MFKHSFAIALILATAPASAIAGDRGQPPTRAVFYGDLNLATAAGVRTLDRRLRFAIRQVCGPRDPITALTQHRCRSAVQASVAPSRAAAIAAARDGRTGLAAASR
jgi:UrcA family protein